MTTTVGYTAFEPNDAAIREAHSRTEQRFQHRASSPSASSIAKPAASSAEHSDEFDEHDLPPVPDDVPSWRKEQLLREREEEQRKKREAKLRRQEKKERNDLLRMLKRGEAVATEKERAFIKVHKSGLQTEWDAVADTGQ
jgi:Rieske Fe-S protein